MIRDAIENATDLTQTQLTEAQIDGLYKEAKGYLNIYRIKKAVSSEEMYTKKTKRQLFLLRCTFTFMLVTFIAPMDRSLSAYSYYSFYAVIAAILGTLALNLGYALGAIFDKSNSAKKTTILSGVLCTVVAVCVMAYPVTAGSNFYTRIVLEVVTDVGFIAFFFLVILPIIGKDIINFKNRKKTVIILAVVIGLPLMILLSVLGIHKEINKLTGSTKSTEISSDQAGNETEATEGDWDVNDIVVTNPDAVEDAETAEVAAPLGTEVLNLKEYQYYDAYNYYDNVPDNYKSGSNWDNAIRLNPGSTLEPAYVLYLLEGKFNKLTFVIQPYFDHFPSNGEAELQIIDWDTGNIVHKERITHDMLPLDVEADISGIENLMICLQRRSDAQQECILSDLYVYPGEGERHQGNYTTAESRYGADALNLKDAELYDSYMVNYDIPNGFTLADRLWKNSVCFEAHPDSYAVWNIGGKYKKLSFELAPYDAYIYFDHGYHADVQITDVETGKVLYTGTVEHDSGIQEVSIDISGVNYLRVDITRPEDQRWGNVYTYCLFSDFYAHN